MSFTPVCALLAVAALLTTAATTRTPSSSLVTPYTLAFAGRHRRDATPSPILPREAASAFCEHLSTSGVVSAILLPGTEAYRLSVGASFSAVAQDRHPPCVVRASSPADVAALLKEAAQHGVAVTARGGGHTARCADDGAVMVDMSSLQKVSYSKQRDRWVVRAEGGAHMGEIVEAGRDLGLAIPVGSHPSPGFGLLLQGGVGYLSRSAGLTLDSITSVELAVPTGEVLTLSPDSTGNEAHLWWAVRGAGPFLGIVTAAELIATNVSAGVYMRTAVYELTTERLGVYLSEAPKLPHNVSLHCLVGAVSNSGDPVLTLYLTAWPLQGGSARTEADAVLKPYGQPLYVGPEGVFSYGQTPPFDPPARQPPAPTAAAASTARPLHTRPLGNSYRSDGEKMYGGTASVFMRVPIDPFAVAEAVIRAYQRCPSRMCRFDFQHAGGASGSNAGTAPNMAFGLRDWEWNTVFYSFWLEGTSSGALEYAWVTATANEMDAVPGLVSGRYAVDIANHGPVGTEDEFREAKSAYGVGEDGRPNIDRLCEIKRAVDPKAVLRQYYRLCRPAAETPLMPAEAEHRRA